MTTASLIDLLWRLAFAACLSSALLLLVRRPLRALAGPRVAYFAWMAVPAAILAAAVPPVQLRRHILAEFAPSNGLATIASPVTQQIPADLPPWLLVIWLGGAALAAALLVRAQHRYIAQLGRLERRGPVWYAQASDSGPALIGLFKPKIVVPADFERRYDKTEQALIIAHEQGHARRGDPWPMPAPRCCSPLSGSTP